MAAGAVASGTMGVDRLHVIIQGRVQGVGFRYATYYKAHELKLTGWVRNRLDDSVEAEFEGSRDVLERMLEWCREGPPASYVRHVEVDWDSGEPRYREFTVRS